MHVDGRTNYIIRQKNCEKCHGICHTLLLTARCTKNIIACAVVVQHALTGLILNLISFSDEIR